MNFLHYYLDKEKRQIEYSKLTAPKKNVLFVLIILLISGPSYTSCTGAIDAFRDTTGHIMFSQCINIIQEGVSLLFSLCTVEIPQDFSSSFHLSTHLPLRDKLRCCSQKIDENMWHIPL